MLIPLAWFGGARTGDAKLGLAVQGPKTADDGVQKWTPFFFGEDALFPPIYPAVAASPACVALLRTGSGPLRFFQFGMAPQNVTKPYSVWQRIFGSPQNYLGQVPDMDSFTVQVDVYAGSADSARSVAVALRDAIESAAYITSWLGESIDPETKSNRFSMQTEWLVPR